MLLWSHVSLTAYCIRNNFRGANFGELLLTKTMSRNNLANLMADLQVFYCIYKVLEEKIFGQFSPPIFSCIQ